ncbi:MAG: CARDB domain-containing protein, partial [candidate division WOR-3 bacterium]
MKLECVLVVLLLIAGTLAAGLQPERVSRTGFTMEIRSEPIPGVPLTGAKIQPLPVTFRTMSGCQVRPLATFEQEMPCEHSGVVRTEAAVVAGFSAGMSGDGLPNLVFYTPSGWDYPIVPSNVRNTHTVGPDLNDSDTTFFDFAVANNGSSTARPRFYTYLYRNGVPFAGFYTESLPPGYYTYYNDYPTMIPAGTHLIAGFTDSTNVIAESLENDNRWSRNFTWRATGQARPNLKPWTPSGWDYPIVPSNVRNTHTVGPDLNDYDTTFIDLSFINNGNAPAQPRFYTYLYLDGRVISGWYIDSLPPGWYGYAEDDPNFVPAGQHTLAMFVDSTDVVSESNEADNRFSNSWTWRHDPATLPNLTYYVPDTSWDYPIVPSNVRGTHRVGPNLNDQDTTFIDWCIA